MSKQKKHKLKRFWLHYYVFYHLVKKYFESKNEEDHMNSNDRLLIQQNDSQLKIKNEIECFLSSFKK